MIGRVGLRSETFPIGWSNADGPTVRGRPGGNRLPVSLGHSSRYENLLNSALNLPYVHEMFDALTPATLATPPRKGIGARIVRGLGRMGAALHGVVAGRLRRRPSGPDSPAAPDAEGSTGAKPARAPRQPRRTPIAAPERHRDLAFTAAMFPELTPAAREFFNTPLEDCDPAMVGLVLEALAEAIAGTMTPQDGMQDARDVFLALSSRLGALTRRDAWHAAGDRAGGSGRGGGSGHAGRPRPVRRQPRPTCLAQRRRRGQRCRPMATPTRRAKRLRPPPGPISQPRRRLRRRHRALRSSAPARTPHKHRMTAAPARASSGAGHAAADGGATRGASQRDAGQRDASHCRRERFRCEVRISSPV